MKPLFPTDDDDGLDDHAGELADLAGYLLGALPAPERERVRLHLPACPRCQAELLVIAPLPSLLHKVEPEAGSVTSPPPAPDGLREAVIGRVVTARRRRRRLTTAASLAGMVVVAALLVAVVTGRPAPRPGRVAAAAFQSMTLSRPAPGKHAEVAVTDHRWGSAIEIKAVGWKVGTPVIVAVVDADGTVERIGSWAGVGPRPVACSTSTAAHLDAIVAVELESPTGRIEARTRIRR